MSLYSGNLKPIYEELVKAFTQGEIPSKGNPILVILDRSGRKYLVHSIALKESIKDNHLIFTAYYRDRDMPSSEIRIYSVALPIDLYAGIELHAELPAELKTEFTTQDYGFEA